jgi:hypothetical protein
MKLLAFLLLVVSLPAFADCYSAPFGSMPQDANNRIIPVPGVQLARAAKLDTSTSALASAAFPTGTRYVGFICDAPAHYFIGVSAVSVVTDLYVPGDSMRFAEASAGQVISFIED